MFISYSHDSESHARWVAGLAIKLCENGVDVVLDQWHLRLGTIESAVAEADRVLVICTDPYVEKADRGSGGVGYEKMIVTSELPATVERDKFIPVVRNSTPGRRTPRWLAGKLYIDFTFDEGFERQFKELLQEIHGVPSSPKPSLGPSPFARHAASESSSEIAGRNRVESLLDHLNAMYLVAGKSGRTAFLAHVRQIYDEFERIHDQYLTSLRKLLISLREPGATLGSAIAYCRKQYLSSEAQRSKLRHFVGAVQRSMYRAAGADLLELRFLHSIAACRIGVLVSATAGCWFMLFATAGSSSPVTVRFVDIARPAGLEFTHVNGASPSKYLMEIMGSGCAFLDYNRDRLLDILLINGNSVPGIVQRGASRHALYRNLGQGRFANVTAQAGIAASSEYGMGVAAGDFDNDGWDDIYITYFGKSNQLYRNNRDGTFADVTRRAGAGVGGWSTSAAFLDYDNDGYLDLYIARYVDFAYSTHRDCMNQNLHVYCSPKEYAPMRHVLLHNNRDGTFRDVSAGTGIGSVAGKGLGVVAADLDDDGRPEIYVANDTTPNFLFHYDAKGTFEEIGLAAGVALNDDGKAMSGMGVAAADYDGDGRFDLAVTNLASEYLELFQNEGGLVFEDRSAAADVRRASGRHTGFGMGFFDFDNDGDEDILVANGHIDDMVASYSPGITFKQPTLLFENRGGRFEEVSARHGGSLTEPALGRGAAFGDVDNDGDVDILVNNCGDAPRLLRNDGGNRQRFLSIRLVGTRSNRDGIGAKVNVATEAGMRRFQVVGGGSYLSSSDLRVHVGLGSLLYVKAVEVRWPSGTVDKIGSVPTNQFLSIEEGRGIQLRQDTP